MVFKTNLRLSVYADPFHSLLLLPIVLALAIGPHTHPPSVVPPAFRAANRRSDKVRSLEKRMGRPLRGSEGPETAIPQSFPWRRRLRMPLPNNDAAGYDDSYYVMRHSSLHGWFKSPCERAMHYRVVVSALTPELKMRKGIHPKMDNTHGFLYLGHSNCIICSLLR